MGKDYYEVLGIRPNAGPEEIELAYRGRRTQYHPDRYANADGETQAWATSRMQEVNGAYAALKDPAERALFDHVRQSQASGSAAHPRRPNAAPAPKEALGHLVFDDEPFERVFVSPHIPRKKLGGAIQSYGEGIRPKDVVALIDDTLFGGAREGILITESEIRFKGAFQSVDTRLLGCLEEISAEGKYVYINGERYAELNIPNRDDLRTLFEAVTRYLQESA
ncbi:DnaJ domain-containing protein [Xanthomonas translucens]|uniref:J domain-containing protein n=1 Tax=Xanthomonas campestris pv. translucens TaxID=343 RepID=UPI001F46C7B2|nr:J domain-containing protein [Xanthomonas translucens]UKE51173.1 DnaJ domain-containing protein [Xanthomonas translucens]